MTYNLHGLFNAKAILVEEQQWYYVTQSYGNLRIHTFPKGVSLKVNVIAWLEFELTYFKAPVQHFSTEVPQIYLNVKFEDVENI